jgi:sarcosine oxidase subunit beta
MSRSADVIVVGAGVMGCSAALELARRGLKVVVVDKAGGPGHGSTSASSAIVRFEYPTRDAVATAWESKHHWANWRDHVRPDDETQLADFVCTGYALLDVPIAPRSHVTALFDDVGVPYEQWDADTLQERIPGIDAGKYWPPKPVDDDAFAGEATERLGALYTPDGGYVSDPQLATQNLAAAAQHNGVEYLFHRAVTGVEQQGGRVRGVQLADATRVSAPVLVNAAGPWSTSLNRLAGVGAEFTIGVRPMRQEVHQVAAPRSFRDADVAIVVADLDLGTYWRTAPGGFLLVGGSEPECDPMEWVDDPDAASPRATAECFRAQVTRLARRLPDLGVPNRPTGIAGVYDVAEDWTPIYDRTDLDGYYVAMGTSGNQFKNAPLVGGFIATLVEGVEEGHDHDGEPLQYKCEYTGQVIDLGTFSRKRVPHAESTGTVLG